MQDIMNELIEHYKDKIDKISKLVFDKEYNYLLLHTDTQIMFKTFDE